MRLSPDVCHQARAFVANVLGAALFVPYAVGLGYAIGYGLGPYVARVRLAEHLIPSA